MRQRRFVLSHIAVTFVFLLLTRCLFSDEVVLTNGDKLSGTVTNIEDGILNLSTDYSGSIKIQTDKIKSITIDKTVEAHLLSGEVLKGALKTVEEGKILIESSDERESVVIGWESLKSLNPAPSKWEGKIIAGANLQSGNTEIASASIGAEAARRTEQDRFITRFLLNYAEDGDEVSTRNTYGSLKYDYSFKEALYGYLSIELLNDKFKDLNLRTVVGPGVGYQIWDDPKKSLQVEAGASYFSEDLKEGEDNSWITGRLASDFSYKIKDSIVFSNQLILYPSFEDFGEYQLRNEAALTTALGSSWALALIKIVEYDSDPPLGVKKNDFYWILSLQYSF